MALDIKPRADADRLKAFELYLEASSGGKFRSLRSIASEIGVSSMTITRWRDVDKWDEKIKGVLVDSTKTAESNSQAIKRRVRRGLLDGLEELQSMAKDTALSAKDRIEAIKAISAIAVKVEAITAGAFGQDAQSAAVTAFNDDLDRDSVVGGPVGGGGVLRPLEHSPADSSDSVGDDGPGRGEESSPVDGVESEPEAGDRPEVQDSVQND